MLGGPGQDPFPLPPQALAAQLSSRIDAAIRDGPDNNIASDQGGVAEVLGHGPSTSKSCIV